MVPKINGLKQQETLTLFLDYLQNLALHSVFSVNFPHDMTICGVVWALLNLISLHD